MLSLQRGARHQGNSADRQTDTHARTHTNTHAHLIVSQNTHCQHGSVFKSSCADAFCHLFIPLLLPLWHFNILTNKKVSHDFSSSCDGEVFFVRKQSEVTVCHILDSFLFNGTMTHSNLMLLLSPFFLFPFRDNHLQHIPE